MKHTEHPPGTEVFPDGTFKRPGDTQRRKFVEIPDKRTGKPRQAIRPVGWKPGRGGHSPEVMARVRAHPRNTSRGAIPHGYTRETHEHLMAVANDKARRALEQMEKDEPIYIHDADTAPDEARAERSSLQVAAGVVLADHIPVNTRLKAADIVLRYTRGVRSKTEVTVANAEDLLQAALDRAEK
jgi:hypothetical protein